MAFYRRTKMKEFLIFFMVLLCQGGVSASNLGVDPQREDSNLQKEQTHDFQFEEDKYLQQERTHDVQFKEDQNFKQEQSHSFQINPQ